jgi:hypothetical protein
MFGDVFLQFGSDDVLWQGDVHDAKTDDMSQMITTLRKEKNLSMQGL